MACGSPSMSRPQPAFTLFTLTDPDRLVIDFPALDWRAERRPATSRRQGAAARAVPPGPRPARPRAGRAHGRRAGLHRAGASGQASAPCRRSRLDLARGVRRPRRCARTGTLGERHQAPSIGSRRGRTRRRDRSRAWRQSIPARGWASWSRRSWCCSSRPVSPPRSRRGRVPRLSHARRGRLRAAGRAGRPGACRRRASAGLGACRRAGRGACPRGLGLYAVRRGHRRRGRGAGGAREPLGRAGRRRSWRRGRRPDAAAGRSRPARHAGRIGQAGACGARTRWRGSPRCCGRGRCGRRGSASSRRRTCRRSCSSSASWTIRRITGGSRDPAWLAQTARPSPRASPTGASWPAPASSRRAES